MIDYFIHLWRFFEILYVQYDHDRLVELGYQPDGDIQILDDKKADMRDESDGDSSIDNSDEKESEWEMV